MKRWPLIAAGTLFFAASLVSTAPATLIDAALQRQTGGKLRLAEARGTLWSGHGVVELRDTGGQSRVAKPLRWRVHLASLWRGQLELVGEFTAEPAAQPFSVLLSPARIEATEIKLRLPAAALGVGFPKAAVLGLSGQLSVHIAQFSLTQKQLLGSATVLWRNAGSGFTPISPLGAYELKLDSAAEAVSAVLKTIDGPLQLDGNGHWSSSAAAGKTNFLVTARVPAELQEQLSPLLRLIGVEREAGSFTLQLN